MAYFSGFLNISQNAQNIFNAVNLVAQMLVAETAAKYRQRAVRPMQLIEVDIIGLQAPQTFIDGFHNLFRRVLRF